MVQPMGPVALQGSHCGSQLGNIFQQQSNRLTPSFSHRIGGVSAAGLGRGALSSSAASFRPKHTVQPRWLPIGPGLGNRLVLCDAHSAIPEAAGLFNPENDRDACGVGFVGELSKQPSRKCIKDALMMLQRMTHRGACGCEANTGEDCR